MIWFQVMGTHHVSLRILDYIQHASTTQIAQHSVPGQLQIARLSMRCCLVLLPSPLAPMATSCHMRTSSSIDHSSDCDNMQDKP